MKEREVGGEETEKTGNIPLERASVFKIRKRGIKSKITRKKNYRENKPTDVIRFLEHHVV